MVFKTSLIVLLFLFIKRFSFVKEESLYVNLYCKILRRLVNKNGCVPWNFPSADDSMPPCKPMERHKFLQAFRTAETNKFVVGGMARCLPNCGGTSYDITVTAAPFRQCDQVSISPTNSTLIVP